MNMQIHDESGDRKYFTMLPNYILNHSTAIDQALYMHMKRYAGDDRSGECWASKRTLMEKMGVGIKTLNKSLDYLIKREWIYVKGTRLVNTKGGPQLIVVYGVTDIWNMNMNHYQGVAESTPLTKGVAERSPKVLSKVIKGVAESAPNKNHLNKNHIEEETLSKEEEAERDKKALEKLREIKKELSLKKISNL